MDRVSREEMAEIDRLVPEKYGIDTGRLMENAGHQVAEFLRRFRGEKIVFYAGKGNNGGDALVAARRLALWNFDIEVVAPFELENRPGEEKRILESTGVKIHDEPVEADVAVDGLIGYNLEGEPRKPFPALIEAINSSSTVVSIDVPTGVDANTGEKFDAHVEPDCTVTLAMPKKGLEKENSGEIWVADISVPPEIYEKFGVKPPEFSEKSLLKLD